MSTFTRTQGPFGEPRARPTRGTCDPAALAEQINAEETAGTTRPSISPEAQALSDQAYRYGWPHVRPPRPHEVARLLNRQLTELQDALSEAVAKADVCGASARAFCEQNVTLIAQRKRALLRARARGRRRDTPPLVSTRPLDKTTDQGEALADLLAQNRDLQSGLSDVRRVLVLTYPDGEKLALDKRIIGLGKERDMWKARAIRAETSLRTQTRETAAAKTRVPSPDPEPVPFPMAQTIS